MNLRGAETKTDDASMRTSVQELVKIAYFSVHLAVMDGLSIADEISGDTSPILWN